MTVSIKNLTKCSLILGGKIITGAETIKCEWEQPERYTSFKDSHDATTLIKNANNNMLIDIELSEGNLGNDVLSLYYNLHQTSDTGVFPFLFKDENGATVITSTKAQVWKTPTVEFKREHVLRMWQIYAMDCSFFAGGIKTI